MKNLLVVDDEKLILSSLSEALKMFDAGFNIITAENGAEAEKILNSAKVDLLITDLNMPVKSGYELLAYVFKKHAETPVIVMTASSCESNCGMMRAMNITHLISKPINLGKMVEIIHTVLRGKKVQKDSHNNFTVETSAAKYKGNYQFEDTKEGDGTENVS